MKTRFWFCFIMCCTMLVSCNKDSAVVPELSEYLLKRKLLFRSIDDKIPQFIYEYRYDSEKRLVRIMNDSQGFDSLIYNSKSELIQKYQFEKNREGKYIMTDSTNYRYIDGFLSQEISYDPWYSSVRFKYRYEYINTKLVRKYEFYYQNFISFTSYEYSGDYCTKETSYTDSIGSTISTCQIHYYKNKRLSGTELFGFNGSKLQIISYSYDDSGNLVTEEAKHPNPNAAKLYYYVIRYEY